MLTGILYVCATTSLLVGSVLTFNYLEMADYFYLLGTSLFFIKATISLYNEMAKCYSGYYRISHGIVYLVLANRA